MNRGWVLGAVSPREMPASRHRIVIRRYYGVLLTSPASPLASRAVRGREGRSVATSAGPAMDVGAAEPAEPGAQQLLYSVTELKETEPATVLLTRLRAAVAPHVAPQVLDDIALFLNVARYRS